MFTRPSAAAHTSFSKIASLDAGDSSWETLVYCTQQDLWRRHSQHDEMVHMTSPGNTLIAVSSRKEVCCVPRVNTSGLMLTQMVVHSVKVGTKCHDKLLVESIM